MTTIHQIKTKNKTKHHTWHFFFQTAEIMSTYSVSRSLYHKLRNNNNNSSALSKCMPPPTGRTEHRWVKGQWGRRWRTSQHGHALCTMSGPGCLAALSGGSDSSRTGPSGAESCPARRPTACRCSTPAQEANLSWAHISHHSSWAVRVSRTSMEMRVSGYLL